MCLEERAAQRLHADNLASEMALLGTTHQEGLMLPRQQQQSRQLLVENVDFLQDLQDPEGGHTRHTPDHQFRNAKDRLAEAGLLHPAVPGKMRQHRNQCL
mmetsp:Transcript_51483/g.102282  ORF Transcript_51483/g.102282 Transcript_51483/m.102282 type:complete len:100 (+) Transcript_51483:43-342(+)